MYKAILRQSFPKNSLSNEVIIGFVERRKGKVTVNIRTRPAYAIENGEWVPQNLVAADALKNTVRMTSILTVYIWVYSVFL